MENRTVRAISAFTAFVGSMKVFNHAVVDADGNVIAEATVGELPAKMAQDYVDAGMAEYVEDKVVKRGKSTAAPVTTAPPPSEGDFVATYKPVGKYEITGPGLVAPEIFRGNRVAADARVAELRAAAAQTGTDTAPVD